MGIALLLSGCSSSSPAAGGAPSVVPSAAATASAAPSPAASPSGSPSGAPSPASAAPSPTSASTTRPTTGPTTTPASAPTAGGPAPCTDGQLALRAGAGSAAAGSYGIPLIFANTGSRACTVRGYPGVSYVAGADGHQVGGAAERDNSSPSTVVLQPRGEASALLLQSRPENFSAASCRPTAVRGIRVYAPGQKAARFLQRAGTACANPSVERPRISPVQRGTQPTMR